MDSVEIDYMDFQRIACVEMPELIRTDAVEGGEVFAVEKKIDGG